LDGFSYDSNDGMVGDNDDFPGKDMVYLTATERVLDVMKTGFKPLRIILSEYGIVLKPREVWQIEINGEGGAESLPVTIRITPNDASLSIDGMVVSASYTQSLSIGQHSINIAKDGFQTIEKTITVDDKNVFFEWTLEKTQTQWLVITSKPDGADLYINDQAVGKTPYQKELAVGKYTFRVQKELYLSGIGVVELVAGTQKQKIEVNLKANYGTLTVRTEPEVNAEVFMNGMSINKISPCQIEKVPSGEKTIMATKNFYQISEQVVTVSPESNLQVVLISKPTFGTISVNSTPESGGIVSLDGLSTGKTTPCTIEKVPAGEHAITVSFEMYETITLRFTLVAGETKPLIINMNPTFAVITLNTEPTAEIYINGELKTNGKWQGRLSPGIYTFEAKLDKHITAIEKQSITIGQPINLTLRPMPKTGNLRIMSIPIEANIKIDSRDVGQTPITIKNMLIGDYSIELSLTGYATTKKQVTITEGHTSEYNDILSAVTMPSVSTQSVTEIKQTTAISGGDIISDGGSKVSAKGVCWSENEIPTTDDTHSIEGSGSNSFSSGLFNLTPNSTYNVRAYATNSEGTTYGDVVDFKTLNDGMKILIKSKPSGANLFIDAVSYGKTPYTGDLKYGNHKIKIESKRRKIEKNILISQGGNTSFTLEFEDNPDMEVETYCSGPEFQSNKDFFRANAISESLDQQV
jgi:hypothetical protein